MPGDPMVSLGYAEGILSGRIAIAGDAAQVAAFIARQGVETLIDAYCQQRCAHLLVPRGEPPWEQAKWASKLAMLLSYDEEYGRALMYAWVQLSNLCHQHAYQLSPTVDEVRNLCLTVMDQVAARA